MNKLGVSLVDALIEKFCVEVDEGAQPTDLDGVEKVLKRMIGVGYLVKGQADEYYSTIKEERTPRWGRVSTLSS